MIDRLDIRVIVHDDGPLIVVLRQGAVSQINGQLLFLRDVVLATVFGGGQFHVEAAVVDLAETMQQTRRLLAHDLRLVSVADMDQRPFEVFAVKLVVCLGFFVGLTDEAPRCGKPAEGDEGFFLSHDFTPRIGGRT